MKLIVIIRDPAPLIMLEEPIQHRRVEIEFTEEQLEALRLFSHGVDRGKKIYEQYSFCFIEE
jgi:hypothetical protein